MALVLLLAAVSTPVAAGKGKKVACKGGKVPVTAGKKTACVPMAKALPKPKAIDPRLAYLQESLKLDLAKSGGRKAKRYRSLQSGFGAAGRRAQKKFLTALPRVLALIDRKNGNGNGPRALLSGGPVAFASACSANGPLGEAGSVAGVGVAEAGDNGGQMQLTTGGLTFRTRFANCGGAGFPVPECPMASGDVKSPKTSGSFEVTEEVLEGSRVVSRRNTSFEVKASARGKVAADAKLDYIVVDVEIETFIVASGGVVRRGKTERHARVDMRTGKYDPADASVKISGDAKPSDDASSFASKVDDAIKAFRAGEVGGTFLRDDGWATFNRKRGPYCAEPVFAPDSNTLKLRKGKSGQLGIYAKARADGGRAVGARWTLLAPLNADFSPVASQEPAPSITYAVTNAPAGGQVRVTAKFTSTAGVGEASWTQPTEPEPTINHISGTFSYRVDQFGSVIEMAGNASFDRFTPAIFGGASGFFKISDGQYTATASGNGVMTVSAPLCSQKGSGQFGLDPTGEFAVLGTGPEQVAPYEYTFSFGATPLPLPEISITLFACDPKAKEQEDNSPYPYPVPLGFFLPMPEPSEDGSTYAGSRTFEQSGVSIVETWSFHGTEERELGAATSLRADDD